jgi:hypothetical protein
MTVTKVATPILFSDEAIVDYGIGSPAFQEAAAARIEARRLEMNRQWMALPVWTRASRRIRWRLLGFRR